MALRTRHNSRIHISIAACSLAGGLLLGACGGGSSDDGAGAATPAGGDVDLEQAHDLVDGAVADTSADASATVVADGTTYEFKAVADPNGETTTFCTTVAGSLQGNLLLVDESGAVVEDGEVTFTFFPPDAPYAEGGMLQDVYLDLPSGPDVIGPLSYFADEAIESEVSGRSATATFTASHISGDLSGTIEVSC